MASNIKNALYVVATPIGNLEDITLRAVDVLKNVDIIACEDTRNTSVLCDKYSINTRLISYHKFSEAKRVDLFLNYLNEGKSIAIVSDAGTPLISDPGEILVNEVRKNGFDVIPIVGASAILALLSSIPRGRESFKFVGFLPRIKNQIIELVSKNNDENLVFYESPNRLIETLETVANKFPNKKIAIARELTKKFEEIKVDNILNIIEYYKNNTLKGEIAGMFYAQENLQEINLDDKIATLKKYNLKNKEISAILADFYNQNKNSIYKRCLEIN